MIPLKLEINKSATIRELRKEAEIKYKDCYEKELQIEAFISGVKILFEKVQDRVRYCKLCEIELDDTDKLLCKRCEDNKNK